MSVDWKQPFEIAFQMLVAIVGWGLVALVALFGLAIVYSLIKAFFDFFTKKPKKSKLDDTYQKLMKDLVHAHFVWLAIHFQHDIIK